MNIRRNCQSIMVWEGNRGIVLPVDTSTNLDQFIWEVREVALRELRHVRFVSLVYDSAFKRNYIPMQVFLNGKTPEIFRDDENVKRLYNFFFSNSSMKEYEDGYIEYDFNI